MHLVDNYTMTPGSCWLCKDNKVPAVDTLMDADAHGYDGRLYICGACVGDMAQMIGWVPPRKFEEAKKKFNASERKLKALTAQFAAAKEFVSEAFTLDEDEDPTE